MAMCQTVRKPKPLSDERSRSGAWARTKNSGAGLTCLLDHCQTEGRGSPQRVTSCPPFCCRYVRPLCTARGQLIAHFCQSACCCGSPAELGCAPLPLGVAGGPARSNSHSPHARCGRPLPEALQLRAV